MRLDALLGLRAGHTHAALVVRGLSSDSRTTKPGEVFFALKGSALNGNHYVQAAIAAGAVAIVSQADVSDCAVPVIVVEDARQILSDAAARLYPEQPDCVVAITGTNGKSSTVDFLRQIWTHAGLAAASVGTLGAIGPKGRIDLGFTTPDPIALHQTLARLAGD
ncbi:MAG: hypothetical protein RL186_1759, partial [Pseudomonadota bacterium]